jgi:hypothetical protein
MPMEKEVLQTAFDDVLKHLGVEAVFKPASCASFSLVILIKEPENVYEVGSSHVVGQVAEISLKKTDATPRIGDSIFLGLKKYKIYEEPLSDASNLIWKFNAILEGVENGN